MYNMYIHMYNMYICNIYTRVLYQDNMYVDVMISMYVK